MVVNKKILKPKSSPSFHTQMCRFRIFFFLSLKIQVWNNTLKYIMYVQQVLLQNGSISLKLLSDMIYSKSLPTRDLDS